MKWGTSLAVQWLKNLPSNAGDVGSIPHEGTKIPHATGQLSPSPTTRDAYAHERRDCKPQWGPDAIKQINIF